MLNIYSLQNKIRKIFDEQRVLAKMNLNMFYEYVGPLDHYFQYNGKTFIYTVSLSFLCIQV